MPTKAVVLLSGGLDSYTAGAMAREDGFDIYALTFDYRQRNKKEIKAAQKIAKDLGAKDHITIKIDLNPLAKYNKSALLSLSSENKTDESFSFGYYVPARNTIFLSYALCVAELIAAQGIVIGVSYRDAPHPLGIQGGYRDCHPSFLSAFQDLAELATNTKTDIEIYAPLLLLRKDEIVKYGSDLGLDYGLTWSCYENDTLACGECKSCERRLYGFYMSGNIDKVMYLKGFSKSVESFKSQWSGRAAD